MSDRRFTSHGQEQTGREVPFLSLGPNMFREDVQMQTR